jgi:hypothetical protein
MPKFIDLTPQEKMERQAFPLGRLLKNPAAVNGNCLLQVFYAGGSQKLHVYRV